MEFLFIIVVLGAVLWAWGRSSGISIKSFHPIRPWRPLTPPSIPPDSLLERLAPIGFVLIAGLAWAIGVLP